MKDDSLFICHNQEILCDVLVKADSYIPSFVLCLFIFTWSLPPKWRTSCDINVIHSKQSHETIINHPYLPFECWSPNGSIHPFVQALSIFIKISMYKPRWKRKNYERVRLPFTILLMAMENPCYSACRNKTTRTSSLGLGNTIRIAHDIDKPHVVRFFALKRETGIVVPFLHAE